MADITKSLLEISPSSLLKELSTLSKEVICPVKNTDPLILSLSRWWIWDKEGVSWGRFQEGYCLPNKNGLFIFLLSSHGMQTSWVAERQQPSYECEDKWQTRKELEWDPKRGMSAGHFLKLVNHPALLISELLVTWEKNNLVKTLVGFQLSATQHSLNRYKGLEGKMFKPHMESTGEMPGTFEFLRSDGVRHRGPSHSPSLIQCGLPCT